MVPRHGRGHEEEVAYNAVDDDCDGADLTDADGDGHDALAAGGADCDDTLADINPTATESWANGFTDDDCDGDNGSAILEFGGDVWAGGRAGEGEVYHPPSGGRRCTVRAAMARKWLLRGHGLVIRRHASRDVSPRGRD